MAPDNIVVIGAGVIGLNVAFLLAKQGYGKHITFVAEYLPGDLSVNYTSPWAGANFSAISGGDPNALRRDKESYHLLMNLSPSEQKDLCIAVKPAFEYWDEKPEESKIDSMKSYLKDFTILPPSHLPQGTTFGISYRTLNFNAPAHIAALQHLLTTRYAVPFQRRKLAHLDSAFLSERTKIVFNCVGGAARTFGGVQDPKCFPTRGQILVVRAPQVAANYMRHGRDYETYIIPRPFADGTVILGGFMQSGVDTGDVFAHESDSIWTRTTALLPALLSPQTQILHAAAGIRPSRKGGARIEAERREGKGLVVHNYGAGGTGFQAGLGMAGEAVALAQGELAALFKEEKGKL